MKMHPYSRLEQAPTGVSLSITAAPFTDWNKQILTTFQILKLLQAIHVQLIVNVVCSKNVDVKTSSSSSSSLFGMHHQCVVVLSKQHYINRGCAKNSDSGHFSHAGPRVEPTA